VFALGRAAKAGIDKQLLELIELGQAKLPMMKRRAMKTQ